MPSLFKIFCGAFVVMSSLTCAWSVGECTAHLPRNSVPGRLPHAMPVPDASGFAVVWEKGDAITLRRYDQNCMRKDDDVEVFHNSSLWTESDQGGLAAAVGIGDDAFAVAWTLGQDVWIRVVHTKGSSDASKPVLASEKDNKFDRAEVRLVANPGASLRFVAAWSSWLQDGSGWGVFARPFGADGQPQSETIRVNKEWRHFQWQPQLAWCGKTVWALWANGSGESCGSQGPCSTKPFIRQLSSTTGKWETGTKEYNVTGGAGPYLAALSCNNNVNNEAAVLLLQFLKDGGVYLLRYYAGENGPSKLSFEATERRLRQMPAARNNHSWHNLEMIKRNLQWLHGLASPVHTALGVADAAPSLQPGEVELLAHNGFVLLLGVSDRGILSAQLVDYSRHTMVSFPSQELASGAWNVRAAWEQTLNGKPDSLVFCFSTGSDFDGEEASEFKCERRSTYRLMNPHGVGWGVEVATTLALALVVVACCTGHCLQQGRLGRLPLARFAATGARTSRAVRRGRTHRPPSAELRAQLARIPTAAVEPQPDAEQEMVAGGSGAGSVATLPPAMALANNIDSTPCSICQSEVAMRVAFQPCGHTACRDCVHQLIERGHTCHICRATLEGVLPVYI